MIDIHCHYVPPAMRDFASLYNDERWPTLMVDDGESRIVVAGEVYRVIDESYYSLVARVAQMDELGIDQQILSALPVTLPYWADPQRAHEYCRQFNELLVADCAEQPDRFRGLGSVPLQDPALAVKELEHVKELGLAGVEIGTWLGDDLRIEDESVLEFFQAAADLDLPLLLHPNAPQSFGVPASAAIDVGVGVGSESARAMASLHLAGSLSACEHLRLCMSHGGGSFLWLWPRFKEVAIRAGATDVLPDCLYADTAGLDAANLGYVVEVLGEDRVMFGSDLPASGVLWTERVLDVVRSSTTSGVCSRNVAAFLGDSTHADGAAAATKHEVRT